MRILSGDAALLSALERQEYRGRVHSVFERVVNVEDASGDLLAIAARDVGDAPGTLVADVQRFAVERVRAGDAATGCPNALLFRLGPYVFRLDAARAWVATLPTYPADDSVLRRNVASVRARIDDAFGRSFVADAARRSALARGGMMLLECRAIAVAAALGRHDLTDAVRAGRAMLGLGPGLTPSGDDFLVGLFAVLHMGANPCGHLKLACTAIVADAKQRTNAISAAALEAAARGRVPESIVALLGAFAGVGGQPLAEALSRVLAIGSSSGAAIARGIIAGFDVSIRRPAGADGNALHETGSPRRVVVSQAANRAPT